MIVSPVDRNSPELTSLWSSAIAEATKKRGGPELVHTISAGVTHDQLLQHLIDSRCLWSVRDDEAIIGFALLRDRIIETLYVDRHHRRRGVARKMLQEFRESPEPPLDAYALPGDRAMKSIYESIGWKARLLTMRGERADGEPHE
ncbi:MAG: GNAT family N-acetyltransferase [Acidimicrobiales bacterium]